MKTIQRKRVARILKKKALNRSSRQRVWFLTEARQMVHCREPYVEDGRKKRNPWCSKGWLCPGCKARKAKTNRYVLYDQFQAYDPELGYHGPKKLYETRISLGRGNISCTVLRQGLDDLHRAWKRITHSADWKAIVERSGGQIHPPWKPEEDGHGEGVWLHLHLVCLVDGEQDFKDVREALRYILDLPDSTPVDDYFHCEPVKSLIKTCKYITHVRNLIPGYPRRKDPRWLLKVMPDDAVKAWGEAMKYRQRIVHRGFDVDIMKASRLTARAARKAA